MLYKTNGTNENVFPLGIIYTYKYFFILDSLKIMENPIPDKQAKNGLQLQYG